MRRLRMLCVCSVLAVLACGEDPVPPPLVSLGPPDRVIAVRDVRVFPATGKGVLEGRDVVVRDGRIAEIRATGGALPDGADVIDGRGRTLLPGFVDAHTHIGSSPALPGQELVTTPESTLEAFLFAGVTTVYDLGGLPQASQGLRDRVNAGEIPGPRIFFTGAPITAPGGHPVFAAQSLSSWPLSWVIGWVSPQVATPDEAPEMIDSTAELGVDYIKVVADQIPLGIPELDRARLSALVERAHEQHGLIVFAHIGSADNALDALAAGVDVLAHGVWRSRLTPEQVDRIADTGKPVVATMWAFDASGAIADGSFQPTELELQLMPADAFAPLADRAQMDELMKHPLFGALARESAKWREARHANVRDLHRAGVPVLVGTDSPITGIFAGGAYHRELELLVGAGLPPEAVLRNATAGGARLLTDDPDFGTIEPGKAADLVLVEGDPTRDIRQAREIVEVIRAGRRVERIGIPMDLARTTR